jgi:hypothetical protein
MRVEYERRWPDVRFCLAKSQPGRDIPFDPIPLKEDGN